MLRRGFATWFFVAVAGLGALALAGCGGQQTADDTDLSSIDSTLALGELSDDVPESDLTPGEEYTPPPPAQQPPPRRSRGGSGGGSGGGSSSPPPSSQPRTTSYDVPAGTALALSLQTALTTKTAQVGDRFTAVTTAPIVMDDRIVIPEGSTVVGHVAASAQPGKISGRAMMQLAFDELQFDGRSYTIASVGDTVWGKSGAGKDAAMIGGGAVAGAVLGKILGGSGGSAAKGAIIGGAAGTAASLATRGPQLEIPEGQEISLTLDRTITVTKPASSGA